MTHHQSDHAGGCAGRDLAEARMTGTDAAEVLVSNAFRPYRPAPGVLNGVAAGAFATRPTLSLPITYEDADLGRDTLRQSAEFDFDTAAHGNSITGVSRFRPRFSDA